jgi:hypothetical protein
VTDRVTLCSGRESNPHVASATLNPKFNQGGNEAPLAPCFGVDSVPDQHRSVPEHSTTLSASEYAAPIARRAGVESLPLAVALRVRRRYAELRSRAVPAQRAEWQIVNEFTAYGVTVATVRYLALGLEPVWASRACADGAA